jgi:hypothetical protein
MVANRVITGCDRPPSQTSVTSTALGGGDERKPATRADKIRMSNPPLIGIILDTEGCAVLAGGGGVGGATAQTGPWHLPEALRCGFPRADLEHISFMLL